MSDGPQGMWVGAVLLPVLVVTLVLAAARAPRPVGVGGRSKLVEVFLVGVACQCVHFLEESLTGLHRLYPSLFGLPPISAEFFVGFNVSWLGIWAVSAFGVLRGSRIAYVPVWFFGLAMCLNGIIHPLLALWVGGYFPGLVTSPVVGVMGVLVTRRLFLTTVPEADARVHAPGKALDRKPEGPGDLLIADTGRGDHD